MKSVFHFIVLLVSSFLISVALSRQLAAHDLSKRHETSDGVIAPYTQSEFTQVMAFTKRAMNRIGYSVHHDGEDHVHFDLDVGNGQSYEVCAHPEHNAIHVWARTSRSIIEMTPTSVRPFGSNVVSRLAGNTGRHYTARRFIKAIRNVE